MDRRRFFQKSGLAVVGAGLLAEHRVALAADEKSEPQSFAFASAPVLINPTPSEITIVCAVNGPATGWVEYGETEALGEKCSGEVDGFHPYSDRLLSFTLSGLRPGQRYFYRVHATMIDFAGAYKIRRGETITSEVRAFRTLDHAASKASLTVWNDTHRNTETLEKLIASHVAEPSDVLMWNGDVVDDIPTEAMILREYLNPAGRAFADTTPLFLSRGNHDVRGREARRLSHFLPGPKGKYYHAFRQGPIACLVLDTGEDKPDGVASYAGLNDFAAYRSEQRRWLEQIIREPFFSSAPFRIAFLHIPLWFDAPVPEDWLRVWGGFNGWVCEDGRNKWHDLLVEGGIQLAISGHTHEFAWFPAKEGRPYGQLIGGGPKPREATTIAIHADVHMLRLNVKNLEGKTLLSETLSAAGKA